ncbi:hypothetical protein [Halomonas sp. C22]|uniref:hypothetical protein n=1 Tax=Halomonas sp. C22 TaxID=2580567 RepID=UPI0011A5188E|nr:hypothetical protein [Halomonas sp. C22]
MITISSKAGQASAKARHAERVAMARFQFSEMQGDFYAWQNAKQKAQEAALALADELIANRHHTAEGD